MSAIPDLLPRTVDPIRWEHVAGATLTLVARAWWRGRYVWIDYVTREPGWAYLAYTHDCADPSKADMIAEGRTPSVVRQGAHLELIRRAVLTAPACLLDRWAGAVLRTQYQTADLKWTWVQRVYEGYPYRSGVGQRRDWYPAASAHMKLRDLISRTLAVRGEAAQLLIDADTDPRLLSVVADYWTDRGEPATAALASHFLYFIQR